MPDEAAVERYARDGIHATREAWCGEQAKNKFHPHPWAERHEHMRELDRRFAAAVAKMAAADQRERLAAELEEYAAGFFTHHGGSSAAFLEYARDIMEGVMQIVTREPLP